MHTSRFVLASSYCQPSSLVWRTVFNSYLRVKSTVTKWCQNPTWRKLPMKFLVEGNLHLSGSPTQAVEAQLWYSVGRFKCIKGVLTWYCQLTTDLLIHNPIVSQEASVHWKYLWRRWTTKWTKMRTIEHPHFLHLFWLLKFLNQYCFLFSLNHFYTSIFCFAPWTQAYIYML